MQSCAPAYENTRTRAVPELWGLLSRRSRAGKRSEGRRSDSAAHGGCRWHVPGARPWVHDRAWASALPQRCAAPRARGLGDPADRHAPAPLPPEQRHPANKNGGKGRAAALPAGSPPPPHRPLRPSFPKLRFAAARAERRPAPPPAGPLRVRSPREAAPLRPLSKQKPQLPPAPPGHIPGPMARR